MILTKLTSKSQSTIPKPIRTVLGLEPGDEIAYEIRGGQVILAKAEGKVARDDPFRTLRGVVLRGRHEGLCGP